MNTEFKALKWTLLCAAMAGYAGPRQAAAQEPAPALREPPPSANGGAVTQSSHTSAQAEAGEPRADTSASPMPETAAAAKSADSRTQHASTAHASGTAQKAPATDRLELGVATVTGDREQPKVMYIVPWKKSDIGDLSGKPMNSLLDEALAPIDRDEFKREVIYYQAVKVDASQNGASRQPAKQGEK